MVLIRKALSHVNIARTQSLFLNAFSKNLIGEVFLLYDDKIQNARDVRWKSYKRFLDHSKVPSLEENDLEEQYVRGSGPGGQATNKTNNAVVLKHKPTGLVVKCHETRSQAENKKIAREMLLKKLDNLINGEASLENQEKVLRDKDSARNERKKKRLAELKRAFKEREGLA